MASDAATGAGFLPTVYGRRRRGHRRARKKAGRPILRAARPQWRDLAHPCGHALESRAPHPAGPARRRTSESDSTASGMRTVPIPRPPPIPGRLSRAIRGSGGCCRKLKSRSMSHAPARGLCREGEPPCRERPDLFVGKSPRFTAVRKPRTRHEGRNKGAGCLIESS